MLHRNGGTRGKEPASEVLSHEISSLIALLAIDEHTSGDTERRADKFVPQQRCINSMLELSR